MANERDRDELDDTVFESDEDARGLGADELGDDEDTEDLEDEDEFAEDERPTGEVGSEGGSPGERAAPRRDDPLRGSEATETVRKPR